MRRILAGRGWSGPGLISLRLPYRHGGMNGEHADVKPPSNGSEFWFCGCDEVPGAVADAGNGSATGFGVATFPEEIVIKVFILLW
jgi:hypothetical protein